MTKRNNIKTLLISEAGLPVAEQIQREYPQAKIYSKNKIKGVEEITSIKAFLEEHFSRAFLTNRYADFYWGNGHLRA